VGETPTVVLGASDSSSQSSLYFVTGAALLSDGRIIVTDGGWGRSRVSIFSPEGRYVSTIGETGDGPGEFRGTWGVQAGPNDSIFVWDEAPQRMTVFSRQGRLSRTAHLLIGGVLAGTEGFGSVARLADGTWAGIGYQPVVDVAPGEIRRDTIWIGLIDGLFERFRPIVRVPGMMSTKGANAVGQPPFGPAVFTASWGRCLFVSRGDTPDVAVYSSAGRLVTSFRGPGRGRPLTQANVDTLLAYRLRHASTARDSTLLRRWLRESGRTDSLPYYHQVLVDEWGDLWLEKYEPPVGMGTIWYVVSQSGAEAGTAHLPTAMAVYSITHKGVLGLTRGSLGEERVDLFPFLAMPTEHPAALPQCVPSN